MARWTEADLTAYQARTRTPASVSTAPVPIASQAAPQAASRAADTPTKHGPKRPKYGNRKVIDASGVLHDSKGELARWEELKLMERAGEIRHLRRQVPFALVVSGVLVCTYVADFVYEDGAATIVEDHKSPPTRKLAAFRIKAKLMQALHGIQIREV